MERPDHKEIKRDPWQPDSIHAHSYLTYLKKIFFSPSITKKVFILGNPSNDMDCVYHVI